MDSILREIHAYIIKIVVGNRPVIANCHIDGEIRIKSVGVVAFGNVFGVGDNDSS